MRFRSSRRPYALSGHLRGIAGRIALPIRLCDPIGRRRLHPAGSNCFQLAARQALRDWSKCLLEFEDRRAGFTVWPPIVTLTGRIGCGTGDDASLPSTPAGVVSSSPVANREITSPGFAGHRRYCGGFIVPAGEISTNARAKQVSCRSERSPPAAAQSRASAITVCQPKLLRSSRVNCGYAFSQICFTSTPGSFENSGRYA